MRFLWSDEGGEVCSFGVECVYHKTVFLISQPKHMLWARSEEPSQRDVSFGHPRHMFKLMGKNMFTILRSNFLQSGLTVAQL